MQEQAQSEKKGVWASDSVNRTSDNMTQNEGLYIGNQNTMKFHSPDCRHAKTIADHNLIYFQTREDALESGYVGCKVCRP